MKGFKNTETSRPQSIHGALSSSEVEYLDVILAAIDMTEVNSFGGSGCWNWPSPSLRKGYA